MLYVQPVSKKNNHLFITLENKINIQDYVNYLDEPSYQRLMEAHPDGQVHFWANTPGENNWNVRKAKVNEITEGTLVYFQQNRRLVYRGVVAVAAFPNGRLADQLWGRKKNQPYEFIYSIRDLVQISRVDINMTDMRHVTNRKWFLGVSRLRPGQDTRFAEYVEAREEQHRQLVHYFKN